MSKGKILDTLRKATMIIFKLALAEGLKVDHCKKMFDIIHMLDDLRDEILNDDDYKF